MRDSKHGFIIVYNIYRHLLNNNKVCAWYNKYLCVMNIIYRVIFSEDDILENVLLEIEI